MHILSKERLLSSKFLNIDLAEIQTKSGKIMEYFFIDSYNTVAAIVRRKNKVILVKIKPNTQRPRNWEIPGGWMKEGETARSAIRRKVEEETGYRVTDIHRLGSTIPNATLNGQEKFYFIVDVAEQCKDFNEDIIERVAKFSLRDVKQMIKRGEIFDERSLTALSLAENKGLI